MLRERAKRHGKSIGFHHEGDTPDSAHSLAVCHTPLADNVVCGKLNVGNADYVVKTLTIAAEKTLAGQYRGIVTAPIHKGIICQSGGVHARFSGHTEFFAEHTASATNHPPLPVMVLGNARLKVALVTTHLPLSAVSQAVTAERLSRTIHVIDHDMKRYFTNGKSPRIGVCGLNPHAGEGGHMGHEEIEIIDPTLNRLREQGINVSAALPADTLFVSHHAEQYDIIVAMYHDQGLPVIKSQGFGECVNITFGLPIVRTSVDHGTALDLAGTDKANPNSLQCAVEMALAMTATAS